MLAAYESVAIDTEDSAGTDITQVLPNFAQDEPRSFAITTGLVESAILVELRNELDSPMSRNEKEQSYGDDPRRPQGLMLIAVLVVVLAAGVYLIVSGLS